jgi:DNA-directed RNA polymerase specialized sigma24 family protein
LPEKNRLPLILCYLEGKTQEEAARQLGWTAATLRVCMNKSDLGTPYYEGAIEN